MWCETRISWHVSSIAWISQMRSWRELQLDMFPLTSTDHFIIDLVCRRLKLEQQNPRCQRHCRSTEWVTACLLVGQSPPKLRRRPLLPPRLPLRRNRSWWEIQHLTQHLCRRPVRKATSQPLELKHYSQFRRYRSTLQPPPVLNLSSTVPQSILDRDHPVSQLLPQPTLRLMLPRMPLLPPQELILPAPLPLPRPLRLHQKERPPLVTRRELQCSLLRGASVSERVATIPHHIVATWWELNTESRADLWTMLLNIICVPAKLALHTVHTEVLVFSRHHTLHLKKRLRQELVRPIIQPCCV